jgi:CDP-diglyceride synthetase
MSDAARAVVWCAACGVGIAFGLTLRRRGVAATYVRDLLHVGAGVWALGLGAWSGAAWPRAVPVAALAAALLVGLGAGRVHLATRVRAALCGGGETWAGVVAYTVAFALATWDATCGTPVPGAAAMLALAWGDGLGGWAGRRWGRRRYRMPWGKVKTWEGSMGVAVMGAFAVVGAAGWYHAAIPCWLALVGGLAAATAEALAPRASDNLLVPAVVWAVVRTCVA